MFLLDTDILSTFTKIGRLDLLLDLFGEGKVAVTENVISEINMVVETGLNIHEQVINLIEKGRIGIISTTRDDYTLMEKLPDFMGAGERDSFAVCINKKFVLVTDDRKVIKLSRKMNVEVISLHMILRALWVLKVCSKDDVREISGSIIEKDRKVLDIGLILDSSF